MEKAKKYFVIDFDSTFIKKEALEELAEIVLKNNPEKNTILAKIKKITKEGMEGKIGFFEELSKRLNLLNINRRHILLWIKKLRRQITDSIRRNKQFFKKNKNEIYIISGAFKECILPIIKEFGLREDHVFANTFIFNHKGEVVGVDTKNPLSQDNGKVKVIRSLKLKGEIYVVGDGHTDYLIKKFGLASKFIAFTENIAREIVVKKADHIAPNFDEFLYINKFATSLSYPKNRIKVLLLENIDASAVSSFDKEGYQVEDYSKSLDRQTLIAKLKNTRVLGIRSRSKIDGAILRLADRLISIGAFCIGTDQIDLKTASDKGICVFNAPYSNTRSVVELILGEIIMLARGIFDKSFNLHKGIWTKSASSSFEVRGKTLGIIGYGNIGSQLSVLAENMGMRVIYYDIVEKLPLGNAKRCKSLGELLKNSDIITVHVDGNEKNKNLIGERQFSLMKKGVLFLNASRGFVVDISALARHISQAKVRGAAVDVFPNEPKDKKAKFSSILQDLPNTILTPHIGGSTLEAQKNIGDFVSAKIIDYINSGNTYLSVNIPNIQLPKQKGYHRLLHLHGNVPGILASINGILAKYQINIEGQYLKTNEQIGYVITDVNKKYDQKVFEELKKVPKTIRFRVLY